MILIGDEIFDENGLEYEVAKTLGDGGFGQVFLVTREGDELALKTANADGMTTSEFQALQNEGSVLTGINHKNVIKVHYFHDGEKYPNLPPYLLMDYAEGGSLKDFIESRRAKEDLLSIPELKGFIIQIMSGLKAINEKFVHRDFHPGNVLFKSGILKVSDFGLSKIVDAATRSRTFKGIQHMYYKAPESWTMNENTIQMDMYSAGIVFYELATLVYPYQLPQERDQILELMDAHKYGKINSPKSINSSLPDNVSEAIMRLLKKKPEDRFLTWDDAIAQIYAKDGPMDTGLDISALVTKVQATERAIEEQNAEEAKRREEAREQENQLSYAVSIIRDDVLQLVEALNKASGSEKLKFKSGKDFSFSVSSVMKGIAVHCNFYKTQQIERVQQNVFDGTIETTQNNLMLDGKLVKFWGCITNQYGKGLNVVLVQAGEGDNYGDWKVLTHKHRTFVNGSGGPEPFALRTWAELERQVRQIRAMGTIVTTVSDYSPAAVQFIFEDIL